MEVKTNVENGFRIENILLTNCSFNRTPTVEFDSDEVKAIFDISVDTKITNDKVIVSEYLKFEQSFKETVQISCEITMVGVFEKVGELGISLEEFGNINGAAILFPYVRENLSNLSLKSGIGNLILPPANFVKMYHDKKTAVQDVKEGN